MSVKSSSFKWLRSSSNVAVGGGGENNAAARRARRRHQSVSELYLSACKYGIELRRASAASKKERCHVSDASGGASTHRHRRAGGAHQHRQRPGTAISSYILHRRKPCGSVSRIAPPASGLAALGEISASFITRRTSTRRRASR